MRRLDPPPPFSARQDDAEFRRGGGNQGHRDGPALERTEQFADRHLTVLVEIGFLTNPEEERLLALPEFQRDAGRALAQAARAFLRRYPPGQGG